MVAQLLGSIDEALKECKKKWNQILSFRIFYRVDMSISSECVTSAFTTGLLKRSNSVPVLTGIPVSALNCKGDSYIACTLHVL